MDTVELVAALSRLATVPVAPGRQLAHQQSDDDEEQLGGEVGLPADPERLVGDG